MRGGTNTGHFCVISSSSVVDVDEFARSAVVRLFGENVAQKPVPSEQISHVLAWLSGSLLVARTEVVSQPSGKQSPLFS